MVRRKAFVVTQKPGGTRMPSMRESAPRFAPFPPMSAICVLSISSKPNTAACSSLPIALLPSSLAASEYGAHPGA